MSAIKFLHLFIYHFPADRSSRHGRDNLGDLSSISLCFSQALNPAGLTKCNDLSEKLETKVQSLKMS